LFHVYFHLQAVSEGRWVVIEDINMAPPDVLAALVPLLESRTLTVASRGEVRGGRRA
jgi:midasin